MELVSRRAADYRRGGTMKSLYALAAAAMLYCAPCAAQPMAAAQPSAVVEGVQMPAWLEREGKAVPLVPGMTLSAGDQLRTGAGSRLLIKLAEGSLVKLGENARLRLSELAPSKDVFRAAMSVLE